MISRVLNYFNEETEEEKESNAIINLSSVFCNLSEIFPKELWGTYTAGERISVFVNRVLAMRKRHGKTLYRCTTDGQYYETDNSDVIFSREKGHASKRHFEDKSLSDLVETLSIKAIKFAKDNTLAIDTLESRDYSIADFTFADADGEEVGTEKVRVILANAVERVDAEVSTTDGFQSTCENALDELGRQLAKLERVMAEGSDDDKDNAIFALTELKSQGKLLKEKVEPVLKTISDAMSRAQKLIDGHSKEVALAVAEIVTPTEALEVIKEEIKGINPVKDNEQKNRKKNKK